MFTKYSLFFLTFIFLCLVQPVQGQKKSKQKLNATPSKAVKTAPKLVVGIVVDQMRDDYLTRFWDHYGEGGFKRMVREGYNCKNNHFNYAPTSTGPGHASVYTGATPATHGIMGNTWYDKTSDKEVYCAADDSMTTVGSSGDVGKMSPHRMQVTTITDQLKLHTQMRSKVIAIALKDRGAVIPAGHTGNAAYWFHGRNEGNWVSSSFYMQNLPKWVADFNTSNAVEKYKKTWAPAKDISTYIESGVDNNPFETKVDGEKTPTFPHNLVDYWNKNNQFDILKVTPFGNSITTDFALAALDGENLGADTVTDFLAISYSSTDYVGHFYGVNSKEVQDTYIRLDQDLERLFKTLDKKVGKFDYTVFLTSDHGAIHVPAYLKSKKIPSGYLDGGAMQKKFSEFLKYTFGTTDIIKKYANNQFFLDHTIVKNLDMDVAKAQEIIANELRGYDGIERTYTGYQMRNNEYSKGVPYILQNGYHQKRSGDVLVVLSPGYASYGKTGSTHGSPQIYDTHVPLLFMGKGVKRGSTSLRTEIPDIAPTIATLLGIAFPNGATGSPIDAALR